ncbi:sensor histidine kinase [Sphaerisporangium fuscum]|uniref:sensor histidine kinase n=1 Tax=Sphaerisporangium fuscum TaxID=2835868 RepID=UPI001BDC425F|nr:histidine kinase [Sphaerisporangium fuscum]
MRWASLAAVTAVLVVDTAVLTAGHAGALPRPVAAVTFAAALGAVLALRSRSGVAAFVAALVLTSALPGAYVLLLVTAYTAGRALASRRDVAVVTGGACGGLAVQLVTGWDGAASVSRVVTAYLVFVAMPLLVGRYLAEHERLVAALSERNRQLRYGQRLLAERERLRERLRIARDMHDSLGQRLALVSIQAAALEVSGLPPERRQGVQEVARAARGALDELYELVGALRGEEEPRGHDSGIREIERVVEEFRAAGVRVTLRHHGQALPLTAAAWQAAYRVVQEGLTNAAKHAPGGPVTVSVEWEDDAALLTVVNPVPPAALQAFRAAGAGHGLAGLRERVLPAGGMLDHGLTEGGFRLLAMFPAGRDVAAPPGLTGPPVEQEREDLAGVLPPGREGAARMVVLGVAAAALVFVVVPGSLMIGLR